MKVSSPIGDLPFEPARLKIKKGVLVMEGSMGAWPATVQIYLSDLPALLRLVRYPLIVLGIVVVVVAVAVLLL